MGTKMHEARIILPDLDNQGEPFPSHLLTQYRHAIAKAFGGYTETMGKGAWLSDRLYEDPIRIFDIAMEDVFENQEALRQIAKGAAQDFRQVTVYVRFASGEVQFILRGRE